MKNLIIVLVVIVSMNLTAQQNYEPTWTSLKNHSIPTWLEDAKFGIYCHWGVWTVQYEEGHLSGGDKLALDDAISKFKAKNFDPSEWARLFKDAGAKFGGPVAWHGSRYLHWDSEFTTYNSVDMLPHRDIAGELEKAIRAEGLKYFMSFHYGTGMANQSGDKGFEWINFAKEAIDKYSPDLFWVDAGFGGTKGAHHNNILEKSHYIGEGTRTPSSVSDKVQREVLAYYFNDANKQNKEVEFIYKSYDMPPGVGMRDLENGLMDNIAYDVWMTDIDMNICPDWETHGWFYREGIPLRTANNIIDILIDVVSKNGILLLNVPPLADGSFNDEIKTSLSEVGKWLELNGEAIYGTSPWFVFGEGPTKVVRTDNSNHHNDHFATHNFTKNDVRYTVNGKNLYAICLGKPKDKITLGALMSNWRVKEGQIMSVELLSTQQELKWEHNEHGLSIKLPMEGLNDIANVFKINLH